MSNTQTVAAITGGGRGIGRGITLALASKGYSVAVNYQGNRDAAEETCRAARSLGAEEAVAFQADVSDLDSGKQLITRILEQFGKVDVWVNNAGVAPLTRLDLLETTLESWDWVLNTNLRGPFFLTQAVAREMTNLLQAGVIFAPKILFISSVSSTFVSTKRGEYCVSKAGLSMVAQLFATRLAEQGILVYEVRPGVIETDMTGPVHDHYQKRIAEGLSPIRRWGTPEDVGKVVASLASGDFPFSTGEVIYVDGGLHINRL